MMLLAVLLFAQVLAASSAYRQLSIPIESVVPPSFIQDPEYKYQEWYLGPDGANVVAAWERGYNGTGVNIIVNDSGMDYRNPEFSEKYNQAGSFKDPMPELCSSQTSNHGNVCAGIAAADANDSCGVGVAFGSTVSAANVFRDGFGSAEQTGVCNNVNHVSSNSYGIPTCRRPDARRLTTVCPFYDSSTNSQTPCSRSECNGVDWSSPSSSCENYVASYCGWSGYHADTGTLDPACEDFHELFIQCRFVTHSDSQRARFVDGVTYGRNGKGMIYVFSSGNDHARGADVNMRSSSNSHFTITVGAIAGDNEHSLYSVGGAALHIVAPAGDTNQNNNMFEVRSMESGVCTNGGGIGTSYSTPIVTGVVALILEANDDLGWRDVQDVLIRSTQIIDELGGPGGTAEYATNTAGMRHSYRYGFGKVDALAAVIRAEEYPAAKTNVVQESIVVTTVANNLAIPETVAGVESTATVSSASALTIESIQHVSVYLTVEHNTRGNLQIVLIGPQGMESILLEERPEFGDDFNEWRFTTLRHWGEESAEGEWKLRISDLLAGDTGTLTEWRLEIYGDASSGMKNPDLSDPASCPLGPNNWRGLIPSSTCHDDTYNNYTFASGQNFAISNNADFNDALREYTRVGDDSLYGPIAEWDTSSVTDMNRMFLDDTTFNGEIGNWDTSRVTTFYGAFGRALEFDQTLNWDTSSVTGDGFKYMFVNAAKFNNGGQPLAFKTSGGTDMYAMFFGCSLFNVDINTNTAARTWITSNVTDMRAVLLESGYELQIDRWDVSGVESNQHHGYVYVPSSAPSEVPSNAPSVSNAPTVTFAPSILGTVAPSISFAPSQMPSKLPTDTPSTSPSSAPSSSPSDAPSALPSSQPSQRPSQTPTVSNAPSVSHSPSQAPTVSLSPSESPSLDPSSIPSSSPTAYEDGKFIPSNASSSTGFSHVCAIVVSFLVVLLI